MDTDSLGLRYCKQILAEVDGIDEGSILRLLFRPYQFSGHQTER